VSARQPYTPVVIREQVKPLGQALGSVWLAEQSAPQ
jgi:hypothetical protein